MKEYLFALCLIGVLYLGMISCYRADRDNPLDGHIAGLFFPQVIRPNGGELWFVGTTHQILWEPATHVADSVVTIQLVCNGPPVSTRVIAERIPNTGQFTWVVPDTALTGCRIRIVTETAQDESDAPFHISPPPVLHQVAIGGEGREPAALYDFIVFTSNRSGNDDLWMVNRRTGKLTPLTTNPGFDGQADWFKPNGNLIAFTSVDSSGQQDIWIMNMSAINLAVPPPIRVTTTGGEQSVWQPSFLQYPSLAFTVNQPFPRIFAVTFGIPTAQVDLLSDPIPLPTPVRLTSSLSTIRSPSWGLLGGFNNVLLYETGIAFPELWKVEFIAIAPGAISSSRFAVPPGLPTRHPALSLSGARVAFSALGDIWVMPINGGPALQVTYDGGEDDFPDWATETTIAFQRRPTLSSPWEIWTVEIPPPSP